MRFSGKANVFITLFLFPAAAVLLIGCSSAAGAPVPTLIPVVESPPAPSPIPTSTTPAPKPTAANYPGSFGRVHVDRRRNDRLSAFDVARHDDQDPPP